MAAVAGADGDAGDHARLRGGGGQGPGALRTPDPLMPLIPGSVRQDLKCFGCVGDVQSSVSEADLQKHMRWKDEFGAS